MTRQRVRVAPSTLVGAVMVVMTAVWTTGALYSFHAALPRNPVSLPAENDLNMALWAPQWWLFFSRDPHLPRARAFVLASDRHWSRLGPGPRAQLHNLVGWNRESEAIAHEVDVLAGLSGQFSDCKAEPEVCLSRLAPPPAALAKLPRGRICGHIGIAVQPPRPWAWRKAHMTMKSRVARLEITC